MAWHGRGVGRAALLALLLGAPRVQAGETGVRLDCLPASNGASDMRGWLLDRLALRGLGEDAQHPAWALCFSEGREQRMVPNPAWGAGAGWPNGHYGAYWAEPAYQLETTAVLSLQVRRVSDGTLLWQGQQALDTGGSPRQRLEQAARKLIDRTPLP